MLSLTDIQKYSAVFLFRNSAKDYLFILERRQSGIESLLYKSSYRTQVKNGMLTTVLQVPQGHLTAGDNVLQGQFSLTLWRILMIVSPCQKALQGFVHFSHLQWDS